MQFEAKMRSPHKSHVVEKSETKSTCKHLHISFKEHFFSNFTTIN